MFTLETGDTLPKGGFAFSGFGDKFGRMPGSVTIFEIGADLSYGITDRLNVYATFDPYGHVHVGCPGQLSLRSIPLSSTCAPLATGTSIPNSFFPVVSGSAPGYVEDYPFAANNNGGVGDITLGLKYALLSQRLGNPVSLPVRNYFNYCDENGRGKAAERWNAGQLAERYGFPRTEQAMGNIFTGTFNFGYMFVRAPRSDGQILFAMPDQVRTGVGFQLFPKNWRFEPMMEYSGVIFSNAPSTPEDMSFGARDPVDGVWGLRMYPWKDIGIDVGYRYMLNLRNSGDRSGFVVKFGTAYWPEKPPPVNHPPTVSCMEDKDMVYFGSNDIVTITAPHRILTTIR